MTMPAPQISIVCSLYRSETYLGSFFKNLTEQTIFSNSELILIQNEPDPNEVELVRSFYQAHPDSVKQIKVDLVEPLGASWNRGWQAASGSFVAIWNVDDRRVPDSLRVQAQALLQDPEAVATYGNYIEVALVGTTSGTRRSTPQFDHETFMRSFPQGGAFTVYRRELIDRIGGFDEQLRVGPDMEFSFRIAAAGLRMQRADGVLGYFTNAGHGLSTRDGSRPAARDRAAIQLRYAAYDKIDPAEIASLKEFRADQVLVNGSWIKLERYWPEMRSYRDSRRALWTLGKLRNLFRSTLRRLGLLNLLHTMQRRLTDRDL
jgi:glycosyltransferase involved in cell wall biosynthesis